MKAVIKCRLLSGLEVDLTAYSFKWSNLKGATILGGEQYFIDKALTQGALLAEKPKPKRRTKKGA